MSKPQVYDRLSELPNSLISHILCFVPMIDVVRTTILSKRWKNLWTTSPFLNFDNDIPSIDYNSHEFRNFVNRALLRWDGIRVLKFKVDSWYMLYKNSIYTDIDLWLNFAKERKVEELYLHLQLVEDSDAADEYDTLDSVYCVPRCLFSCSSLAVLSLKVCSFKLLRNVQWNQLKSLSIIKCFEVTEHAVNEILSGSPLLEVFNLSFVDRGENLNIRSSSLKELSICKYLFDCDDLYMVSELTIRAPNLETLELIGIPYAHCRLRDVSSLIHVSVEFYGLIYREEDGCHFPGIRLENGFLSSQDYIGEKFIQILETIQHVESVTLYYCCLKVLRAMKKRCMHSTFPNVKSLTIGYCYGNYEELVGLFEIFPHMESLVLKDDDEDECQDDPDAVEYDTIIPKTFMLQLRTIEVTWTNGDSIFPVIEILLKYASKLKEMVFQIGGFLSSNSLLLASNKLMNMPRSSTNCRINIIDLRI